MKYRGTVNIIDLLSRSKGTNLRIIREVGPDILVDRSNIRRVGIVFWARSAPFSEVHRDGVQPRECKIDLVGWWPPGTDEMPCRFDIAQGVFLRMRQLVARGVRRAASRKVVSNV